MATLSFTVDRINAAGFEVGQDIDDLDEYEFADVADASTGPIFLIRHVRALSRAFTAYPSVEFSRRDALLRLERELHCQESDYEWITPHGEFPGYIADEVDPDIIARDPDGTPLENMPWSRRLEEPRVRIARPA